MSQVISHSETESFNQCSRRHYYSFGECIEPIKRSQALNRGVIGHAMWKVFWENFPQGIEEAKQAIINFASAKLQTGESIPDLVYLMNTMLECIEYYTDTIKSWTVVEFETTHRVQFQDFEFAFTPDLVVREANGNLRLIDYKFVYDFYEADMFELLPQIPRYIGGLQLDGVTITKGSYFFLRYRNVKSEGEGNRFAIRNVPVNGPKISNSFRDVIKSAERIAKLKALSLNNWLEETSRTSVKTVCNYCPFKRICVAELNGSDGRAARAMDYQHSTYGYVEASD